MTESESMGSQQDPADVLVEKLLEEFLTRGDRGEKSTEDFIRQSTESHREHAAQIRERLPGLIQLALDLDSACAEPPIEEPLLEPDQLVGNYRIKRFIARGGMGEVYLARHTKLGTSVAIKLLPAKFSNDAKRLANLCDT